MASVNRRSRRFGYLLLIIFAAIVLLSAGIFAITFLVDAIFAPLIEVALKVFTGAGR